ncbi:hypothetical protein V5799_022288 [Amblyomma americanum]|uniref:Reverse transcriptase domain-containing protein n=1 Tax=Amblyomma americanum TaxID=6943 RepID=A0AAQ4FLF7_AMBAM
MLRNLDAAPDSPRSLQRSVGPPGHVANGRGHPSPQAGQAEEAAHIVPPDIAHLGRGEVDGALPSQARALGEAAFLVLLDIKSAFDCLPHWAILDALGISGHLLQFLQAFLRDRYLCVRVGQTTGSRHSVPASLPVRGSECADDIAVFARTPTRRGQVQRTLGAIADYLRCIGLTLSPQKSEALMMHPTSSARRWTLPLHLDGTPLPWRRSVRYLGLTIDARLTWGPVVKELRSRSAVVASLARRFLAQGSGCSPAFCLRIYEAVATTKALYALPLVGLSRAQWTESIAVPSGSFTACRGAPHRRPRTQRRARGRGLAALNHVERMQRSGTCGDLLAHLKALSRSHMGAALRQFYRLLGPPPPPPPRFPPPHQYRPPRINTVLPGVRSKRSTPHCALRQEVAGKVQMEFAGHTVVYTDGSVREEAAGAACIAPTLPAVRQVRLNTPASSLTAELAAISLAADVLAALHPTVPLSRIATSYDSARLALRRFVTRQHPDPRVASAMTTVDTRRFVRADYALLFRLRTGSGWTSDRHRDPPGALCALCGSADTLEHILCVCPASFRERLELQQGYRDLGLPCSALNDVLFPAAPPGGQTAALRHLLRFIGACDLRPRL